MLVSNKREWVEQAAFLATQAKEPMLYYEHKEFGYNYRMSNVLAAIGVAQMEVIDKRVERKREIFERYRAFLENYDEVHFMPEIPGSRGNRWLSTLFMENTDPLVVIDALEKENIESRPLWKPMHLQPLFRGAYAVCDGTSERLFERGLCLPSGSSMSDDDVYRVCNVLQGVLG